MYVDRAYRLFVCIVVTVSAEHCERKVPFFGKVKFSCPEPGDPIDYRYCCRDGDNGKCCSIDKSFEGLDVELVFYLLRVVYCFNTFTYVFVTVLERSLLGCLE